MSRLQELSEINIADFAPSVTYFFAENNTQDSKKIKASTVLAGVNNIISDAINELDKASIGGSGKYIESISEADGIIQPVAKSFGSIAKNVAVPVPGGSIYLYMQALFSHNIPRLEPKDITAYYNDGTLWKRLNGTDGFSFCEDVYAGDYFQMSRAITCPDSYQNATGTDYVTIAEINGLWGNGDGPYMNYNHLIMVPGKGFDTSYKNHFGRHAMNNSNSTAETHNANNPTWQAYGGSVMRNSILGPVVSTGSTASGATINQQLYAEFGSHLKTTRELISITLNSNGYNRFGSATGCSGSWGWSSEQSVLLSEVEVYGSIVWSSSGYDTGTAKKQFAAFKDSRFLNNRQSYYWLKDVASVSRFCLVNDDGLANYGYAGNTGDYVRPRFVLAA